MKIAKVSSLLVLSALALSSFNALAVTAAPGVSCAPLVKTKIAIAPYAALNTRLSNAVMTQLYALMKLVKDAATYNSLAAYAKLQVAAGGRIVITTPDGIVVYDSSKGTANTYANFVAKTINENHNSRIAILNAQLYECGLGVETKYSSTDKTTEDYVAARLGLGTTAAAASYLHSLGTVRLSVKH
ncbi:MAG: hypothetical protein ABL903_20585 [Methylococcales bacterium]